MRHAILVTTMLVASCTQQRSMTTLPALAGESVSVELLNGVEVEATVVLAAGQVELLLEDGGTIGLGLVARVVDRRRGRGLLQGLAGGAAIGFAAGAVFGYAEGDDVCENDKAPCFTAGDYAMLGGTLFGVLGGLVGAVVGASVGKDVYVGGSAQAQQRLVPSGPPGSVVGATLRF